MKKPVFTLVILLVFFCLNAQNDTIIQSDSSKTKNESDIQTGWGLGVLPAIAYDADLGFKYGALLNLYYYGNGETYPDYLHSLYFEWNRTTKGSGTNQFFYDSPALLSKYNLRITLDASYLTEQGLNFYGFNGAESNYISDYEDDKSTDYISRMYYRYERKMFRLTADFQGKISGKKIRWLFGIAHFNNQIGTVDIDRLNKGKEEQDKLPDTLTLYDKYRQWNLIPEKEADGGINNYLKAGIVYDTRDIEANPSKGIWTELLYVAAPGFFGNKENAFSKIVFIHRQYFTLLPTRLTFVYRLGYQGTIDGDAPFYMQSYMFSSYSPSVINEGLGGAKSMRGVFRNRIVGDGFVYGNFEFRYKFLKTKMGKKSLYMALNLFADAGMVVEPVKIDRSLVPATEDESLLFSKKEDIPHFSYGLGLHTALDENFVFSINYGFAGDKQDGNSGLYIGTNWLF